LRFEDVQVDWTAVQTHVRQLIQDMRGGPPKEAQQAMRERGIDLFMGEATFKDARQIEVNEQTLAADNILIATGAQSLIPDIPGLNEAGYITHKEAVYLDALPERLAVVGGGPMGVEFAQMFGRFGVKVSLIEAQPNLLPHDDPELTQILETILTEEGIDLHLQAQLTAVQSTPEGKQLTLRYENDYEQSFIVDEILITVGRKPSLTVLKPEVVGIKLNDDGWIKVDDTFCTNVPHIWAVGDIWPGPKFTHVAARQARVVIENIFSDKPQSFTSNQIPWVTYSDPALAHVGATEQVLREKKITYHIGRYPLEKVSRAVVTGQTNGLIKILIGEKGEILGADILATHAGDLLAPLLVAMQGKLPISAVAETIFPYPTFARGIGQATWQLNKSLLTKEFNHA
jgi:pyruvate/2-oxoglutarate dehydrogenase complex dihydrolipoamide dehydrogenase (E3) component